MNLLRDMIDSLKLIDFKPNNGVCTWNNRRCGAEAILERLDRFLVSCYWMNNRLITSLEILDWRGSDHWPIKLSVTTYRITKNPSFKFQLMWLRYQSLQDLMVDWRYEGMPTHGTTMYTFCKKLQHVKYKLKKWNKQCFRNLQAQRIATQSKLENITRLIWDQGMTLDLSEAMSPCH